MDKAIASLYFAAVNPKRRPVKAGHQTAGFLDQEHAGGGVPGIEVEFPEAVIAAAGDIDQVEGRRSRTPHTVRAQGDLVIEVDVRIQVPLVAGKASPEQRLSQLPRFGDVDWLSVESRAITSFGGEHLIACRIVEDAGHQLLFLVDKRYRDAEHRVPVRKVGGAIQGIDIPAIVGSGIAAGAFFADNAVAGPARVQAFGDQLFRGAVSLGHDINVALVLERDVGSEVAHQHGPSLARNRFNVVAVARHPALPAELPFFSPTVGRGWRPVSSAM